MSSPILPNLNYTILQNPTDPSKTSEFTITGSDSEGYTVWIKTNRDKERKKKNKSPIEFKIARCIFDDEVLKLTKRGYTCQR